MTAPDAQVSSPRGYIDEDVHYRRPGQGEPRAGTTEAAGWIVERITHWLLDSHLLDVYHDVMVKTVDGQDERQIDVLMRPRASSDRTTWTAVQCKNESNAVDILEVEAFFGALHDIGVPTDRGFMVAVKRYSVPGKGKRSKMKSGYTKPAKRRANAAGIRTWELTGLAIPERLVAAALEAVQDVVFLVASIESAHLVLHGGEAEIADILALELRNAEGAVIEGADLIWRAWTEGLIPMRLGQHTLSQPVPVGLFVMVGSARRHVEAIGLAVNIVGYVHQVEGKANVHHLQDAESGSLQRFGVKLNFAVKAGEYVLTRVQTEAELSAIVSMQPSHRVMVRVKVPRIAAHLMFWPPSERVLRLLRLRAIQQSAGRIQGPLDFQGVEGSRLDAAWDPIAEEYLDQWTAGMASGNLATLEFDVYSRDDPGPTDRQEGV